MPKVGIGLTTYKNIKSADFGLAFYEALIACSPKLAPSSVEVILENYGVEGAQDFASFWCNERKLVVRPKYGVAPSYIAPGNFGAHWRTKGALSGRGEVFFGGVDPNNPSTLLLEHNYAAKPNWTALFLELLEVFEPAQANIHVFTKRELDLAGQGRFAFRQPIVGEGAFTHWKSKLGDWRGPDPWEILQRRNYRFVPELAWGTYFGAEFSESLDKEFLLARGKDSIELCNGVLLKVTEGLIDVIKQPDQFEAERNKIRSAFPENFFRSD